MISCWERVRRSKRPGSISFQLQVMYNFPRFVTDLLLNSSLTKSFSSTSHSFSSQQLAPLPLKENMLACPPQTSLGGAVCAIYSLPLALIQPPHITLFFILIIFCIHGLWKCWAQDCRNANVTAATQSCVHDFLTDCCWLLFWQTEPVQYSLWLVQLLRISWIPDAEWSWSWCVEW